MDDANEVFGERMHFQNHNPESLEVTKIQEGRVENGIMQGYSRVITVDVEDACQLGFFVDSEPKGKHVFYKLDGTFSKSEGLYDGNILSTKITIANYMQKISRTHN